MSTRRVPLQMIVRIFLVAGALIAIAPIASPQQIDTARALSALRDAKTMCETDHGALWKRDLCGPIALVDRQTRLVIANDTVRGKHFLKLGDAYVTTLPENQYVANTSFPWGGRTWTMVALPLPRDRYARADLVMHEVFHREQEALGLRQVDALNNHLDMRPGRTWLRIEYRALARALEMKDNDSLAIAQIRAHLKLIQHAFQAGDFSTPEFVHMRVMPGTDVMSHKRALIRYTYANLPRGGEVRITTTDPESLTAIQKFMTAQRVDHKAGGQGTIPPK